MKNQKRKSNKNTNGMPEISSGHDIAMTSSKWLGALVFYLVKFGKIPMKELWSNKYSKRNLWVGYFVKLLLLFLALFLFWKLSPKDIV